MTSETLFALSEIVVCSTSEAFFKFFISMQIEQCKKGISLVRRTYQRFNMMDVKSLKLRISLQVEPFNSKLVGLT